MINVGVLGASGRMGKAIIKHLQDYPGMQLVAVYSRNTVPIENASLLYRDHASVFAQADVVIDFTSPFALESHLDQAIIAKKPLVVGTTGLSKEQKQLLARAGQDIPLVYAENTSIGANLMIYLVNHVARCLDESFDIEVLEIHHRNKIDAPSGTALALGRAAARGRNLDFDRHATLNRSGLRRPQSIGFSAQRGGSVVGEHVVSFLGDEEAFDLKHRSFSRDVFVKGALQAAAWVAHQKPGLYTMTDVLRLHELFTH